MMSKHDESCEAQGPGESCCCEYRAEMKRVVSNMNLIIDNESFEYAVLQKEIKRLRELLQQWRQTAEIAQDITFASIAKATDEALGINE